MVVMIAGQEWIMVPCPDLKMVGGVLVVEKLERDKAGLGLIRRKKVCRRSARSTHVDTRSLQRCESAGHEIRGSHLRGYGKREAMGSQVPGPGNSSSKCINVQLWVVK